MPAGIPMTAASATPTSWRPTLAQVCMRSSPLWTVFTNAATTCSGAGKAQGGNSLSRWINFQSTKTRRWCRHRGETRGTAAGATRRRLGPRGARELPLSRSDHRARLLLHRARDLLREKVHCLLAQPNQLGPGQVARPRALHPELGLDAARARAHEEHAVSQEERLLDRVRDEEHGLPVGTPDAPELLPHDKSRLGFEPADATVHAPQHRADRKRPR